MLKRQHTRHATRGTIPYLAGQHLHKTGPLPKAELFAAVSFGAKPHRREDVLNRAIEIGWLTVNPDGKISCSADAHEYYDSLAAKQGQAPAAETVQPQYRGDWRKGSLSAKHIPNRRGPRADVPAWSVREAVSIVTIKRSEP